MSGDNEDPELAAARLEAALERIAHAATREVTPPVDQNPPVDGEELAARLDELINRLRTALGTKAA